MDWPEIISEGFPGPRDGEPPDLRREIADELNDHLACAMQRELHRTDDPAVAEKAVLDRFGNPKRIARQLWWDAMKEQIMKDRIMIGMMVLTLVICAAVGFFAWRMMQQGQQVNQAILAKLAELSVPGKPAAQSEVPADWSKLTFRCFEGDGLNKPAAKVKITIFGRPFSDTKDEQVIQMTDDRGLTTFGPIRPGRYDSTIAIPGYEEQRREVALYAGQATEQIINVASTDMQGDVVMKVNWPKGLEDRGLMLCCRFAGGIRLGETYWTVPEQNALVASDGTPRTDYTFASVVWPPDAQPKSPMRPGEPSSRQQPSSRQLRSPVPAPFSRHLVVVRGEGGEPRPRWERSERLAVFPLSDGSSKARDRFRWPAARYRLHSIYAMTRATDPESPRLEWIECARVSYDPRAEATTFDAQPGRLNTWIIDVPEDLVKQARENVPRLVPPDTLTEIKLQVAWPEDLADKDLALSCQFAPDETMPDKGQPNQWWYINPWQTVVLTSGDVVWGYRVESAVEVAPSALRGPSQGPATALRAVKLDDQELKQEPVVRRPATTYRLTFMLVLNPASDPKAPQVKWSGIARRLFSNPADASAFVAEKGKLNTWTIKLPDDLLKEIREYVAKGSQPASEPAVFTGPLRGRR